MSYKPLQLFPQSTHEIRGRNSIGGPRSSQPVHDEDATFLHSWLVYDSRRGSSESNQNPAQASLTWNKILGLALVLTVGASFWTAIGIAVARVW